MDRVQSLVRKTISCIFTCNADIIRIGGGEGGAGSEYSGLSLCGERMGLGLSKDDNILSLLVAKTTYMRNRVFRAYIYEPAHDKTNKMLCATSEDSD